MQLKRRKNTRASKAFAVIWTFYYMSLVYETSTCLLGGNFFQYFDHKVLSYEQQGILLMLPFLIIGTLELFFSQLTEIMGRRKAIFIGALFTASAYVGISQWQAFYRLMLCMFSLGVGISLLSGAFRAWTNTALDDLNQGHRRVHESVYIHYAALLLGSLGSVYLLSRKSSYTFLVSGVLLIVGFAPAIGMKENYGTRRYAMPILYFKTVIEDLFANLVAKYFIASYGLVYIAKGIFFFAWQRLIIRMGYPEMYLGIFYFVMVLSSDFGRNIFKYYLSETFISSREISVGMIAAVVLVMTGQRHAVLMGLVLFQFVSKLYDAVFKLSIMRELPKLEERFVVPMLRSLQMFGLALGILLSGMLYETGIQYLWLSMIGLLLFASFISTYKGYCMIRSK